MLCVIWHHLNHLNNVKNTHEGVLLRPATLIKATFFLLFSVFFNWTNGTKSSKAFKRTSFPNLFFSNFFLTIFPEIEKIQWQLLIDTCGLERVNDVSNKSSFEKPQGGGRVIPTDKKIKVQELYSLKFLKQSGMINFSEL